MITISITNTHTGPGDWPIEVAQQVLLKKFPENNITLTSKKYQRKSPELYCYSIRQLASQYDLVVELQYPTSSGSSERDTASQVDTEKHPTPGAWYDYKTLPIGGNNERTHFIAVRDGLVYDAANQGRTVGVVKYGPFRYTKKVYAVVVKSPSAAEGGGGGSTREMDEDSDIDEYGEADEGGG